MAALAARAAPCICKGLLTGVNAIQVLEKEAQEKAAQARKFPEFEAGDLLELTLVQP